MKKRLLALFFVFFLAFISIKGLIFRGYFETHDDLSPLRQMEMEKCIQDLQIPCRWVPDMGYGYGFPLFNYYPPLPYLVGEVFRIFGFSIFDSLKTSFALSLILSGVAMYFLGKRIFGLLGGVVSSAFYMLAPYRAVDVYVRGALNESWAFVFFPLIFLFAEKPVFLALAFCGLFLSHSLMTMIFLPFYFFWAVLFCRKNIKKILTGFIWGIGLAAFFMIPSLLELNLIRLDVVSGYFRYQDHFAGLKQLLLDRNWGYGFSGPGLNDGMSFMVGHVHWILSLILLIFSIFKKKKQLFFLVAFGWAAVFMASGWSEPLWMIVPVLKYLQFPWRFLALATFFFSFSAGFLPWKKAGAFLLVVILILANAQYFKTERISEKDIGRDVLKWKDTSGYGIFDYLPKSVVDVPQKKREAVFEIIEGVGKVEYTEAGTNWVEGKIFMESEGFVRINVFDFPKWKVAVDGKDTGFSVDPGGGLNLEILRGEHLVKVGLYDTLVRKISNLVSFAAWIILGLYLTRFLRLSKK